MIITTIAEVIGVLVSCAMKIAEAPRKAADPSPFTAAVSGTMNREIWESIPNLSLALYISGIATTLVQTEIEI